MSILCDSNRIWFAVCLLAMVGGSAIHELTDQRPTEVASVTQAVPLTGSRASEEMRLVSYLQQEPDAQEAAFERGETIYRELCASCHGEQGEGQTDDYEEPLYGDRSLDDLTLVIEETMPDGAVDECVGDDASAVAQYMYAQFYTAAARIRHQPPRVELSRMTVDQFRYSVADLVGTFVGSAAAGGEPGLAGQYYNSRSFKNDEKKLDRIDRQIDFDFGQESPVPGDIGSNEFSMRWQGAIQVGHTGEYQFFLSSQNGVRLWVNGEDELIDGWVNSSEAVTERSGTIYLLAGRAYPIRIEFFSFEDDTASLKLEWVPPGGVRELVPASVLTSNRVRSTYVVDTPFPPDDASVGYERGTAVSQSWDESVTSAAIEAANRIASAIDGLARTNENDEQREEKIKAFAARFVETAFRRPLTEHEVSIYISRHFEDVESLEESIKRVVMLTLKSPQFLFLGLESQGGELSEFEIASRLSFALWDSLPDETLLRAARRNELRQPQQLQQQITRMMSDPKARTKVQSFFSHWLPIEEAEDISKDIEAYPGFDQQMIVDLRHSLDIFLEEVVWSEPSDFRELIRADFLYVNERIASFYEIEFEPNPDESNEKFQRVQLDPNQRSGILTHPLLMATLAYHRSSSPIHRGVFVTRNVLSRGLNPPPEAIEFLDDRFDHGLTMREKVAQLTEPAACQSCHRIINPLGFSLENYDAVGRYRVEDQSREIDASGVYVTSTGESIELHGARDLAEYAANSREAQRGFVEQLFQHTVKQSPYAFGATTLDELTDGFIEDDCNIQRLLKQIVMIACLRGVDEDNNR